MNHLSLILYSFKEQNQIYIFNYYKTLLKTLPFCDMMSLDKYPKGVLI